MKEIKQITIFDKKNDNVDVAVIKATDLGYNENGYFVLDRDCGYGYFHKPNRIYTSGGLFDEFGIHPYELNEL